MSKKELLKNTVEHIDITSFDARSIIDAMRKMSFSSRATAHATDILSRMIRDKKCTSILTLAGSTSAGGCMQVYVDMIKNKMIDVVVATGASIVDMDFFEALGFRHYQGSTHANDRQLRNLYIDRIYDTYIDEDELQVCDNTIKEIADSLEPRPYSSREFIREMGKYLTKNSLKKILLYKQPTNRMFPFFVRHSVTAVPVSGWLCTSGKIRPGICPSTL